MAIFEYVVSDAGERRTGTVEAGSMDEAGEVLRGRALVVLKLSEAATAEAETASTGSASGVEKRCGGLLTAPRRVEAALGQLAALLDAGVLAVTALEGVGRQSPWLLRRALLRAAGKIREGVGFVDALQQEAPWLGDVPLGLMRVGEANGQLGEMLRYGSEWLERKRRIRRRLVEAMAYPAVVTILAFGVGYFLVTRVIPKILEFIVKNTGTATLPPATQLLVDITNAIQAYGLPVLLSAGILVLGLALGRRNQAVGRVTDLVLLYLPAVGRVFLASANAIWCRTLGLLLGGGVHVVRAFELVQEHTYNRYVRAQMAKAREEILLGASISEAMKTTALPRLCPMAAMMLEVGEGAGTADASLLKAAQYAEEDLLQRIELLSKLIEPAIYIVVGTMVGFVYYAFFMATQAVSQSLIR